MNGLPGRRLRQRDRTFQCAGAGRHAESAAHFYVHAFAHRRRAPLRRGDPHDACTSRLPATRDDRGRRAVARVLRRRARARHFRDRHPERAARAAHEPGIPVPQRAGSGRRRARCAVCGRRPRARVAFVVLPVEQPPGRRAPRARRARPLVGAEGLRATDSAHARRSARERARREFRRPMAVSAQFAEHAAGRRGVSELRREPAPSDAHARPSCSSRASCARIAACSSS